MFFDVGPVKLAVLAVVVTLLFGPDRLPRLIQDAARLLRRIREFSDHAKEDIRSEMGPGFQDFEFEDLHPRTFVRKHLRDEAGLGEFGLKEIGSGFDLRREMAGLTDFKDAVRQAGRGRRTDGDLFTDSSDAPPDTPAHPRKPDTLVAGEPPPFDPEAT